MSFRHSVSVSAVSMKKAQLMKWTMTIGHTLPDTATLCGTVQGGADDAFPEHRSRAINTFVYPENPGVVGCRKPRKTEHPKNNQFKAMQSHIYVHTALHSCATTWFP